MRTTGFHHDRFDRRLGGAMFVSACLLTLGIIDAVLTPMAVLLFLSARSGQDGATGAALGGQLVLMLIVGWTLAGLLLGLSALLRYAHVLARSSSDLAGGWRQDDESLTRPAADASQAWYGSTDPGAVPTSSRRSDRPLLEAVREIRDLVLLSPREGDGLGENLRAAHQRQMAAQVVDAINMRQIGKARAMLENARALYGDTSTVQKLSDKLDQTAGRYEPLDYARTKRLVDEAALEGQWVQAENAVRMLFFDHPDVPRCRTLWDDFRRVRLHAYIQDVSGKRFWLEALAGAEEFLVRFPDSSEAQSLQKQMDTLRHNAEVEQRQRYESRVHELVDARRFGEALRVANHLIQRFPDSPQAHALRPRLAEWEEHEST